MRVKNNATIEFTSIMGRIFWDTPGFSRVGTYSRKGKINRTIDFMKGNISINISLQELSGLAGLSENHYALLFRKQTGFSPVNYFIRLKIQNACRDLDLSDKLIYEIADGLGFSDCYYFSRVFKKVMGLSPRAYRKRREDHYFRRWKT